MRIRTPLPPAALLCLGLLILPQVGGSPASGQLPPDTAEVEPSPPDAFFYRGLGFGSDAAVGPLGVILNKGFAKTQISHYSREIFSADYGFSAVWDALLRPGRAVERSGGWESFISDEILPVTFNASDISELRWDAYPNYAGHLLEGGIIYRQLAEWFRARGTPHPFLLSGVTSLAASILNEAYENPEADRGVAGMVADLYVFDLGGILLFSSDRVSSFFARSLRATVWTGQASLTLPALTLVNNGNHLILKPPLPLLPRTSLFFRTGLGLHLGLTLHGPDGLDLSLGAGSETEARKVDPETGDISLEVDPSAALYLDRNNSLMATLAWSERADRKISLNVYPGVTGLGRFRPGIWTVVTREGRIQVGILASGWWGMGVGVAR